MSHPALNVVWGVANAVTGIFLLDNSPVDVGMNGGFVALVLGVLASGTAVASYFHRWRQRHV